MPVPALAQSGRVPFAESFSKNVGAAAPGRVACLEKIDGPPPPIDHPRQGRGSRPRPCSWRCRNLTVPRTAGALMSRFETGNLLLRQTLFVAARTMGFSHDAASGNHLEFRRRQITSRLCTRCSSQTLDVPLVGAAGQFPLGASQCSFPTSVRDFQGLILASGGLL